MREPCTESRHTLRNTEAPLAARTWQVLSTQPFGLHVRPARVALAFAMAECVRDPCTESHYTLQYTEVPLAARGKYLAQSHNVSLARRYPHPAQLTAPRHHINTLLYRCAIPGRLTKASLRSRSRFSTKKVPTSRRRHAGMSFVDLTHSTTGERQ